MRMSEAEIGLILVLNWDQLNRGSVTMKKDASGSEKVPFLGQDHLIEEGSCEKMLSIQKMDDGVIFKIKVQPGAPKNEIVGFQGDVLKIKISAPPVKGNANRALVDLLAEQLGVKKSEVEIMSGHTSRIKKIKVVGEGGKIEKNLQRFLS